MNCTLTQSDYVKAHMLAADRRDAILSELLFNHHTARPDESYAVMLRRGIERALASGNAETDNRVY